MIKFELYPFFENPFHLSIQSGKVCQKLAAF